MREPPPLLVLDLIPRLDALLITLLESLSDRQWMLPTLCRDWSVRDIAAHLLDGNVRRLSVQRDGCRYTLPPAAAGSYRGLVDLLNRLNRDWVVAARRLSPALLLQALGETNRQLAVLISGADPFSEAPFGVAWAGETESPLWFDLAREYTEKWHHQQQIREAVGAPGLLSREFLHPVLDTFLRGLPHCCRNLQRPAGTLFRVTITGEAGGDWFLRRDETGWRLLLDCSGEPDAVAVVAQEAAWRIFTKGLDEASARRAVRTRGDRQLASHLARLVAVMAYR